MSQQSARMHAAVQRLIASQRSQSGSPDAFTEWCQETIFTPEMAQAVDTMERICDLQCEGIYGRLRMDDLLREAPTPALLARALGFVDSANITLEAILWRLATRTRLVEIEDQREPLRFRSAEKPQDTTERLSQERSRLLALGEDYLAAADFLDFGAQHFVQALGEDPELLDRMLSGREKGLAELWDRATNVDPTQDAHGRLGAKAIADLFPGGTVLEIGAGTGNGTRHLFEELSSLGELGRIERYIFTDISLRFILNSRRGIRDQFPTVSMDSRFLDINKPLLEQKLEDESLDLVYGVNSAHVAKDIVEFLKQCRRVLRPGGAVLFSERVRMDPRQMAPREFTLNLSVYHRSATQRHPDYRPAHCYLTPENWLSVLEMAGFEQSLIAPDLSWLGQKFPDPYAAVIIGTRS